MSTKSVKVTVALAASVLLSLPAALAADYHVPDIPYVDYNVADGVDVDTTLEITVKGPGYSNHIGTHVDYDTEVHSKIDHSGAIDVPDNDLVDVPSVTTDQALVDEVQDLMGMDYINAVTLSVDGDAVQGDPDGVNEKDGNKNVQENKSVLQSDPADSTVKQNLTNNGFNPDPALGGSTDVHNSIEFDITADAPITEDIAVNAAAGAFNLQANSMVTAIGLGILGQSHGSVQQDTVSNGSVLQDATNEIFSSINLEDVTANVGINLVSGAGNEQINSFTATTSFGP
jgi:hypothetical protein